MITDFQNQLTYCGILDDVVYRYPWSKPIKLQSIHQQLVTSAIYGKKILISDGCLIANPLLINDISNVDTSLIGNLLMSGAGRLFCRSKDFNLAEGFEKTAERVPVQKAIVDDRPRWKRLRSDLEYLSSAIRPYMMPWPSDKNMGQLFLKLLKQIADACSDKRGRIIPTGSNLDFDSIFTRFERSLGSSAEGARSRWEEACWAHYCASDPAVATNALAAINEGRLEAVRTYPGYEQVRQMMWVANEVYHLAYTVGASHSATNHELPGIKKPAIGVATALVTMFDDLVTPEEGNAALTDKVRLAELKESIIPIPAKLKLKNFEFIPKLSNHGPTRRARDDYLEALKSFIDGDENAGRVKQAKRELADLLAKLLVSGTKTKASKMSVEVVTELLIENAAHHGVVLLAAAAAAAPVVATGAAIAAPTLTALLAIGGGTAASLMFE
jgi:hypothetical protein